MSPRAARAWWVATALALLIWPLIDTRLDAKWQIGLPLVKVLAYAVLGLGLNLVTGSTGLLNLGAGAFMAFGAYAFGILTCPIYPFGFGFWSGAAGAFAIAGCAGLVLGLPTMRLRGDYLAIVTIGFGEITRDLLINLDAITKGMQAIGPPLADPTLFGFPLPDDWRTRYYLYLGIVAALIVALTNLERSRFGRTLAAVREDELAARCVGINVTVAKLAAFAGGSAICGLAGALYAAHLDNTSDPSAYNFQTSIMALAIVILGGLGSIRGVLLGALIIGGFNAIVVDKLANLIGQGAGGGVRNPLLSPTNWKYLIYGLVLVLMMRYRPEGLLPSRRRRDELHRVDGAGAVQTGTGARA